MVLQARTIQDLQTELAEVSMRILQIMIITFFAILVSTETEACAMRLTWDHNNERVDGSPLPNSQIKHFEIRCTGVGHRASTIKFAKPNTRGYTVITSKPGKYACIMIVYDINGLDSAPSNKAEGECK